jgi:DNA invertase Pin-like site-specific DNA recombinase
MFAYQRKNPQYSIVNQQCAISAYAQVHGYETVTTYADPARSGLDLKGRPGLRSLLDDVLNGPCSH